MREMRIVEAIGRSKTPLVVKASLPRVFLGLGLFTETLLLFCGSYLLAEAIVQPLDEISNGRLVVHQRRQRQIAEALVDVANDAVPREKRRGTHRLALARRHHVVPDFRLFTERGAPTAEHNPVEMFLRIRSALPNDFLGFPFSG